MFGRYGNSLRELIGEMREESQRRDEESKCRAEESRRRDEEFKRRAEESRRRDEEFKRRAEESRRLDERRDKEFKRRDEEFKLSMEETERRWAETREFHREILLRNEKVYTSVIAQLERNTAEAHSSTEETRAQTQALLRLIDRMDEAGGAAAA